MQLMASVGRCWQRLAVGAGLVLAASLAGAQPRFDHWRQVDAALKEIGAPDRIAKATPAQVNRLVAQLIERGQFYLDLHDFERVLVRDHALERDSIARSNGAPSAVAAYFLGRAYHELGRVRDAQNAYDRALAASSSRLRPSVSAWRGALSSAGERSWQADLAAWRAGKSVREVQCPATAPACSLLQAVAAENPTNIVRWQRELATRPADYRDTVRGKDGTVVVDYYDPVVPWLLGVADYTLAAIVLRDVATSQAARGLSLLRTGRVAEAEPLLRAAARANTGGGQFMAWHGEALARLGRRPEAEDAWKGANGPTANLVSDARAAAADTAGVRRQFQSERGRDLARLRDASLAGSFLARALLRTGGADEARQVLEEVRPASLGTDLDVVRPDLTLLASHANYLVGQRKGQRDHWSFSRGDLGSLAVTVPVVGPTLNLLQLLTANKDVGGIVR